MIYKITKSAISEREGQIKNWRNEFDEVVITLNDVLQGSTAKQIKAKFDEKIAPFCQFVKVDALYSEDYPNGIAENSIYVWFKIDFIEKKVKIWRTGSVWISPQDKEKYVRDSYLAMHSMLTIVKRNGGKVMRKSSYKSARHLAKKIAEAYNAIMEQVVDYTGGYPYKEGIKALKNEK